MSQIAQVQGASYRPCRLVHRARDSIFFLPGGGWVRAERKLPEAGSANV